MKRTIYSVALLAAVLTSCSYEESFIGLDVREPNTWRVSINAGPSTKAISIGGNTGHMLYTNWDDGDEVAVVKNGVYVGTLTADASEGNSAYAVLEGTLTGTFYVDDEVQLYYHEANIDYSGQNGTLASVSRSFSYLTATSTVQVVDGEGGFLKMSEAAFSHEQAFMEISFTDESGNPLDITKLSVYAQGGKLVKSKPLDGETVYANRSNSLRVVPESATSKFFLALRDENGEANQIVFVAKANGHSYTASVNINLQYGHYYIGNRAMTLLPETDLGTITENYTAQDGETLTGTLAANVKISIEADSEITLKNATINGVYNSSYTWAGLSCIGDATIELVGTNSIRGFYYAPGISVPYGSTLTIDGTDDDYLTASASGWGGAGIGGGYNQTYFGNIIINGGNITATGNVYCYGIGGMRSYGLAGYITINGGNVTANGGNEGGGIGGRGVSSITINGGIVTAYGPWAGIGASLSDNIGDITINGGVVNASSQFGPGIGCYSGSCGTITINDGTVTATGGYNGAGIGSGSNGSAGNIVIRGGVVTAQGGGDSAGIGAGPGDDEVDYWEEPMPWDPWEDPEYWDDPEYYPEPDPGLSEPIHVHEDADPSFCGSITITGGTVTATGGNNGAGIGTGFVGSCGDITITSGVTSVTATKGSGATHSIGIGNNGSGSFTPDEFTVTIGGNNVGCISESPYTWPAN